MQPSPASSRPLPRIGPQTALFLDFDGTLVDIAPQPEAVQVPADLVPALKALERALQGALAIVSGRPMADLDGFLAPLRLSCAAEHGAHQRRPGGRLLRLASPELHEAIRLSTALAERHPGLQVEIKPAGLALHYRQAPELEAQCLQLMEQAARDTAGLELLRGKYVLELKPAGISKGMAIAAFMAEPPFAGRLPLFAGDDLTDETGFAAVQRLGGQGIKVGEGATQAACRCATPLALRQWLGTACSAGAMPVPDQARHPTLGKHRS